jgi:ectoine hydroxylase-related dioxygenase (phytanoyl-CoA dioxygenase family)
MQYVYHRFAVDAVNFQIAFDDADEKNGALQVVPGLEEQLKGKMLVETTERGQISAETADQVRRHTVTGESIALSLRSKGVTWN